jgi:hypothetical protein
LRTGDLFYKSKLFCTYMFPRSTLHSSGISFPRPSDLKTVRSPERTRGRFVSEDAADGAPKTKAQDEHKVHGIISLAQSICNRQRI